MKDDRSLSRAAAGVRSLSRFRRVAQVVLAEPQIGLSFGCVKHREIRNRPGSATNLLNPLPLRSRLGRNWIGWKLLCRASASIQYYDRVPHPIADCLFDDFLQDIVLSLSYQECYDESFQLYLSLSLILRQLTPFVEPHVGHWPKGNAEAIAGVAALAFAN